MTAKDPTPTEGPPPDDDFDAPPSPEELAAAEALRSALERGVPQPDADFARALRAAHAPGDLATAAHERILAAALGSSRLLGPARLASDARPRSGAATHHARPADAEGYGRVLAFRRASIGAVALVAAAASALLVFGGLRGERKGAPAAMSPESTPAAPELAAAPLLRSRSTQDLFPEPFPRGERASRRVDRIASARARDLRENRFAEWGVR